MNYKAFFLLITLVCSGRLEASSKPEQKNDLQTVVQNVAETTIGGGTPARYVFTDDGRRLVAGAGQRSAFYDLNQIQRVDLTFSQPDWWSLLTNNYSLKTDNPALMTYKGTALKFNVGVRFKGNTSYNMNRSEKKSFAITVDFENGDQKVGGYKNLNFNCAFGDNSFMREVIYGAVNERYIPALSSNYIDLYINGMYWGIYINSQQIDNDFTQEWFFSKNGSRWRAQSPTESTMMRRDGPPGGSRPGGMPDGFFPPEWMPDSLPEEMAPGRRRIIRMPGGFPRGMQDSFPEGIPGGFFPGGMPDRGFPPEWMQDSFPEGMPGRVHIIRMPGGMGAGRSSLNYLGDEGSSYEPNYTLKKSYRDDPWQDLAEVCRVLNQTPPSELEAKVREVLDLDRTLWFLACEIIFADDDGYVNKGGMDYYIYIDAETGRLTPLEYDGNEVLQAFNVAWSPFYNETNANYPLLNRLLAVPTIRQRYLAHFRTILAESFNPDAMNEMIDRYAALIDAHIQSDPKKMTSYEQFTKEVSNLKNIIRSRYNYLMSNAEVNVEGLTISDVQWSVDGSQWAQPLQNDRVCVTAKVSGSAGIGSVNLYAGTGLTGNFSPIEMNTDGDGLYRCYIPAHNKGVRVRFYIEATASNSAKTKTYEPARAEQDVYTYVVKN